jgi:DNA invertase Pin-like site-specific DNA recombinase
MTNEQRQQIKMLRYQGVGYTKIAKAIGLSRDSVRNYCTREGLNGYASELVVEYRKVMTEEMAFVVCLNCGTKLE